ncbi:MAG: LacI family DNA-binding transcriptional regulator [Caldilineaceae bacterium]
MVAKSTPAKLADVARRAGVSTASVSRVLAGKPHVSENVRQRVLTAVHELNFRPSRLARSLRAQRSHVLGLIISDIQNPFFVSIVRAIEDIAYQHQYSLVLCNADEDPVKEALYIELMIAEKVAGVIISPTHETATSCQQLAAVGIPLVAVDRRVNNLCVDTVVVDNISATFALVSHLIADGHRRIGAVVGAPTVSTGHERRDGYLRALQAHGLAPAAELLCVGPPTTAAGYQMVNTLLDLPNPPTALFLGNNLLTIGALKAIHERNLQIPEDVAVAAFDEMDWMFVMKPALTVVAQPVYAMGKCAAELLLARITDPARPIQEIVLEPTIQIRQSCGRHGQP